MKFIEQIKAELKKRGLDEGLFDQIKVEKEEDIEGAVFDFAVSKRAESDYDKRIDKALKTREENLTAKHADEIAKLQKQIDDLTNKGGDGDADKDKNVSVETKALLEQIGNLSKTVETLTSDLTTLKTEKAKETQKGAVSRLLKEAKLPESFGRFIHIGEDADEDAIKAQIDDLKKETTAFQQSAIDEKLAEGFRPLDSAGNAKPVNELVQEVASESKFAKTEQSAQKRDSILKSA